MDATAQQKEFMKGGAFLIENRTANEIFTPEDFTDEHKMIGETIREFVDNEVRPNIEAMEKHDWETARKLVKEAGDLGLLGANIPEEYGGAALDQVSGVIIAEYGRARRRFRDDIRRTDFDRSFADFVFRFGRIKEKMDSADRRGRRRHGLLPVGSGFGFGRARREMPRETFRRRHGIHSERRKNVDFKRRICRRLYRFRQS